MNSYWILLTTPNNFSSSNPTITLPKPKWECDLALSPDPDFWTQICRNIFTMTTNTNLQLIQYITIHRTHITQSKMFKMGLTDRHLLTMHSREHWHLFSCNLALPTCSLSLDHSNWDTFHDPELQSLTVSHTLPSRIHLRYPPPPQTHNSSSCLSSYCQENNLSKLEI